MVSEIVMYVLAGITLGFILGRFFSNTNQVGITVTLEDIERALKQVSGDVEAFDEESISEERSVEERMMSAGDKMEYFTEYGTFKDINFYRVNMPMFVCSTTPEKAYYKAKRGLKKLNGLFFKSGAIDISNVYVEKVTEDEVNSSYTNMETADD